MDKQEAMKALTDAKHTFRPCWSNDCARDGFEEGIDFAFGIVNKLDEPEKPTLTKEEAEWIEGLKEEQELRPFWTKYSMLYFITRCGFGYGFSYDHEGREIELKHYPHEVHAEKERLANAIFYGYEIEKEKLYTAVPNFITNSASKHDNYLNKSKSRGTFFFSDLDNVDGKYQTHFTQEELEKLNIWNNLAFEVEEVEE